MFEMNLFFQFRMFNLRKLKIVGIQGVNWIITQFLLIFCFILNTILYYYISKLEDIVELLS